MSHRKQIRDNLALLKGVEGALGRLRNSLPEDSEVERRVKLARGFVGEAVLVLKEIRPEGK